MSKDPKELDEEELARVTGATSASTVKLEKTTEPLAAGGGGAGKAPLGDLTIVKRVDSAERS